ncbi:MAG: AAA family ATPase, partial [Gammaproteobacteria bacterium]|nr:AAA family ATPase [Gammaproteobacteria bacterium]
MQLKSLEYTEFEGKPEAWILEGFTPGKINLLVGKNASGKSRILSVIHDMARGIVGKRTFFDGNFIFVFDENGQEIKYELKVKNNEIILECFTVGNKIKLERGAGGEGEIYAIKEGKTVEFQTPVNQHAVLARRD